jgi:hypothetical protein
MAKTTYSKAELTALIKETQQQVRDLLKSEDAMAKNADCAPPASPMVKEEDKKDGPPPKKDESSDSSSESSGPPADDKKDGPPAPPADDKSSAAPPAGDQSAPPAPGADASASAPPADPTSAAPAAPAPGGDPAGSAATGDSVEALKAAYAQLSPEALKAHYMALKEIISAQVASAQSAAAPVAPAPPAPAPGAPVGAPPAVAPAPAAPAAPAPDASAAALPAEGSMPVTDELAMKNENELNEKLAKSETKITELEKSLNTVTKAFELLMRKPERKALRGKDVSLAKSEPVAVEVAKLSATELAKKLAEVAKNPELKKSDRNLINGYFNKKVKAADLQVLFDKK